MDETAEDLPISADVLHWHSAVCSCHTLSTNELRQRVEEVCIEANSRNWSVRGDEKAVGEDLSPDDDTS